MQRFDPATRSTVPLSAPPESAVKAELERVLASPHLQASDRRRAFLRFIVEETLAGREDRLKGHTIAVAVFGRDETFDAQADPVVRLEARRLRRDLDSYYVDAGSLDTLRISIPKGSYVPRFDWQVAPRLSARLREDHDGAGDGLPAEGIDPSSRAPARSGLVTAGALLAAFLVVAAAAAIAGLILGSERKSAGPDGQFRGPAVVVLPFEARGAGDDIRYLADGISEELIGDLMRFPGFRLFTLPPKFPMSMDAEPVSMGRNLGVAYVISGNVLAEAGEIRVAAQMADAATGEVLWTGGSQRAMAPDALIRLQDGLAGDIATALGQPYGAVASDLNRRAAVSNMQSYICVLRAYGYRRSFSRAEFEPVFSCLKEAVRRDPDYSDAWAMLGWLFLDAGRFEFSGSDSLQDDYEKGFSAATKAVTLEPDNTLALKALSAINHYMGRFEEGERLARRAVELNPHDPDTLAQLGWRLAARGQFAEGIPVLQRAIERSVNPPGWYYHFIAIDRMLKGDIGAMLQAAERSAADGSAISQALIAIASGELGNGQAAKAALEKMGQFAPLARDPAGFFSRHGATDEIVAALMQGLDKAREAASK